MDKRQANRAYAEPDPNPAVNGLNTADLFNDPPVMRSVRIEVYKGNKYQGKKTFSQNHIIIGKSLEADLVLSDDEIADRHACITYIDEQLVILDQTQRKGLLIGGGLCGISIIDSSEQVGIGPYILKIVHNKVSNDQKSDQHIPCFSNRDNEIAVTTDVDLPHNSESIKVNSPEQDSKVNDLEFKNESSEEDFFAPLKGEAVEEPELYDLVFEGNTQEGIDINRLKRSLSKILKTDESRIEHFLSMKRVVLKSGLPIDVAKKYKKFFEKSGAICRLTVHSGTDRHVPSIQEEKPEDSAAMIQEQSSSEIDIEVQSQVYEDKPDNNYESQIENKYISPDDEIVSDQAYQADTKISLEDKSQTQETDSLAKEEKSANPVTEIKSSSDGATCQTHYSNVEESTSEAQLQNKGQEVTVKQENADAAVEELESGEDTELSDSFSKEDKPVWKFYGVDVDEEDDEDEGDSPADFLLKDRIDDLNTSGPGQNPSNGKYLEIIKLRGDNVIDIKHLEEKEKFFILNHRGKRFCLAEVKGSNEALFSFYKALQVNLEADGRKPVEKQLLMKSENCISKRKGLYRTRIPNRGKVLISDGYFDYQMRIVNQPLVPQASEIKEVQKKSYRHFGVSFAFHIVFLLFLGLFPSFDTGQKAEEEARFVKLDSTQLAELERVMNPQPKPPAPKPPAVKPEIKKQAKPTTPVKKTVRVASNKKPSKTKAASRASRHPDAGGGFGEGNVSTRNINETGILGMISDSVGIQPRNALAAVTNLDAVSSPNVKAGNFTVGGVVGKLGTGEIAVPKGTIVSTKGSSQVLRSYGRKGEGTVAALEKGKTGEQEVMGMVTAILDKSARIRGGLSMDAVKRVIDEHLDDITYCYETELIANPSIVGKVMFEWKILMSGEVGEVRIKSSSINSHEIHACIKDAIRTWRFPKPRGSEVIVSYPFVFDIVGF